MVSVAALTLMVTGSYIRFSASFLISGGIVAENSAVWRPRRAAAEDRLDVLEEAEVEHLVGLVEHHVAGGVEEEVVAADHVHHPADGADHDLRALLEPRGLVADRRAAEDGDHRDPAPLAVGAQRLGHLDAQLARGREHQRLDLGIVGVDVVEHRQAEGGGLAGAGLGLADHVPALQQEGDRLLLDRSGVLVAEVLEGFEERLGEARALQMSSSRAQTTHAGLPMTPDRMQDVAHDNQALAASRPAPARAAGRVGRGQVAAEGQVRLQLHDVLGHLLGGDPLHHEQVDLQRQPQGQGPLLHRAAGASAGGPAPTRTPTRRPTASGAARSARAAPPTRSACGGARTTARCSSARRARAEAQRPGSSSSLPVVRRAAMSSCARRTSLSA